MIVACCSVFDVCKVCVVIVVLVFDLCIGFEVGEFVVGEFVGGWCALVFLVCKWM